MHQERHSGHEGHGGFFRDALNGIFTGIPAVGTGTLVTFNDGITVTPITSSVITLGVGTNLLVDNQDGAVITGGNGDNFVLEYGANAIITVGDGREIIIARAGSARVTTGDGRATILLGGTNNGVTVGNNTAGEHHRSFIDAGTGVAIVTAGNGDVTVKAGGVANNITLGNGDDHVRMGFFTDGTPLAAPTAVTGSTLTLGNGHNMVFLNGSADTLIGGTGTDTYYAGLSANEDFLVNIGGGNETIVDFNAASGDKVDLSWILSDHGFSADPALAAVALADFVSVSTTQGGCDGERTDTVLTVKGTGGTATVTLANTNASGLGDLMGSLRLPH